MSTDLDGCDESEHGAYPVHDAVYSGNWEILLSLINEGQDLNTLNDRKETPAFIAATRGQDEALKLLLNNGADPDVCNKDGVTPLLTAITSPSVHEECFQILLEKNADPNIGDSSEWTPLHEACYRGGSSLVERLIKGSAFANVQTDDGVTPLYTACQYGNSDCVQFLLEWGAHPNICTNEGDSPLHIVCQEGHSTCLKFLLKYGVDVNHCNNSGLSALALACRVDEYQCAWLLIDEGADLLPNVSDSIVESPIHVAARHHSSRCLDLLVDKVDVNLMFDGTTPLFEAASTGNIHGCKLLLSKGADPNCECSLSLRYTPLMIAVHEDYADVVKELVSSGADVNQATFTSPLILAIKVESFASFNFLLECDVNVNYVDCENHSALTRSLISFCRSVSMASVENIFDSCRNLLKSGADISLIFAKDAHPTVRDLWLFPHPKVVKLILEFDVMRKEVREICEERRCHEGWKPLYDIVILPRKLQHLCRVTIRRTLGYKRIRLIDELSLPNPLKSYLKHDTPMEWPSE